MVYLNHKIGGEHEMTQGERVREIRKAKGLTLEKFGDKIGLKKNSVSQIENGKNELTEANAKAICREYNVSEIWLKNEIGEMFLVDRQDQIAKLTADLFKGEKDSFKERLILALAGLDESEWEMLEKIAEKIAKEKD